MTVLVLNHGHKDCSIGAANDHGYISYTLLQPKVRVPSSCIRKLEKDIMNGAAYPHVLFCDATGVRCCQSDGTRTFGCKRV